MADRKKIYYTAGTTDNLREIKRFRLKIAGIVALSLGIFLVLLLGANHLYYNFLGLGYDRVNRLTLENEVLRHQLATMTEGMNDLHGALNRLTMQANTLRLAVDLPPLDNQTARAGVGGGLDLIPENLLSETTSRVLQSAQELLDQLNGEMRIQNQSYEQIVKKIDYNKEYFACLPAVKPMEGYYSARSFGGRIHPVLGTYRTHQGIDIINDVGTQVVAAGDGVVRMAGHSGGGYGIVVVLNHGYGYQTLYGHLSRVLVREGQKVKRGDIIARSGRTGLVSGPHLHYEVRHKGVCQNPVDFFLDDESPRDQFAASGLH